jgi:hypothetical protein
MRSFVIFYSSPNIIRVIKSMRMRWGRPVAHMKDNKCIQILSQNLKGRDHLEDKHRWQDNITIDLKRNGM